MTPVTLSFGRFTIHALRDGFFSLDGGSMFGVVPKVLWEKRFGADRQNRIRLGLNSLLIQAKNYTILVETGIGRDLDKRILEMYSVEQRPDLIGALQEIGFAGEDIDFVINTHLHFDHCGNNTHRDSKGEFVPTFPNATYIIQRGEWDCALNPNPRDEKSYLPQCFLPIKNSGLLKLVDGNTEVTDGVEVVLTPGHTMFHQSVRVRSEGKTLFYLGDMVPTSGHVNLPYIMSYDLYPLQTLESKRKIFEEAIRGEWIVAFVHDPEYYFGTIDRKDNKYVFSPWKNI
jgi:glyoxylase-like metal-dependent hydrolase (beta-lactamase superfamily II)